MECASSLFFSHSIVRTYGIEYISIRYPSPLSPKLSPKIRSCCHCYSNVNLAVKIVIKTIQFGSQMAHFPVCIPNR